MSLEKCNTSEHPISFRIIVIQHYKVKVTVNFQCLRFTCGVGKLLQTLEDLI